MSQKEVIGPVVCVYTYRDLDEALGRANQLAYSFQAEVFTKDIDLAMKVYRGINGFAIMVNDHAAFL